MRRFVGAVFATLALACLAATSTPAVAQVEGQTWEVELYLGYYDPSPSVLDSDVVWGMRLGYNFSERLNLFGDFGRFDGSGKSGDVSLDYDARGFDFNAGWHFTPEKKWATLLYGGIGWAFVDVDVDDATEPFPVKLGDDSFTFNFGAAGKLRLKKMIYLRFDVRARWYTDREEDAFDTLATVAIGWTFGS